MLPVEKVTIVGLGLIGGSLGMAWTQGQTVKEVTGIDLDERAIQIGLEAGAIHRGFTDLAAGAAEADLVLLAVPVGSMADVACRLAPFLRPGCIVTDVGSTKGDLVRTLERCLPAGVHYVGGHPMSGSEKGGVQAADRYLFENAAYLITPTPETDRAAVAAVAALVRATGARVVTISPEEHDIIVAAVSHLPHLLAAALVHTVGTVAEKNSQTWALAAGGFRDTTRIAAGNPLVWRDICFSNRGKLLEMIAGFRQAIDEMETYLMTEDHPGLTQWLDRAKQMRALVPAKTRGLLPVLYELVITVPDQPGVLGNVATLLGGHGLNISDIEIMRVREGEGGTIRLGFSSAAAAEQALEVLKRNGINARHR